MPAEQATVPLTDDGFLRGDAVFEAVLVREGRTHALDAHLARLARSAAALALPLPDVRPVVADLLAAWGAHDGAVRVVVTRGGLVRGLIGSVSWPPAIGLAVVEQPWRTALSGVKTLSYAANQHAVRTARSRGADDALILEGDHVLELPTGAVVLVHDGVLSTPDPERLPVLDSVTVQIVAEVAEVTRTTPTLADLLLADEVFVVSATRPVLPVDTLVLPSGDRRTLPGPGSVTTGVQARVAEHIAATMDP